MIVYQSSLLLDILLRYHQLFPDYKMNVLKSYGVPSADNDHFFKTHRDKVGSLALDSGAYSFNNAINVENLCLSLDGCIDYILQVIPYITIYFNFDIDFRETGFEMNLYNQMKMEAAGLTPVPVIHNLFSSEIDYYIKKGYKMVAVGSQQITTYKTLRPLVMKAYKAKVGVHLFGHPEYELNANLPISSCDSASWALKAAYGSILFWNPYKNEADKRDIIYIGEYSHPKKMNNHFTRYKYRRELEEYLDKTFHITYSDLLGKYGAFYKSLVNVHYYVILEQEINKIHREKGFGL
ncbi:MAG: hypothetical protein V1872_05520 [bacterium]